jgi:hypothetical protein
MVRTRSHVQGGGPRVEVGAQEVQADAVHGGRRDGLAQAYGQGVILRSDSSRGSLPSCAAMPGGGPVRCC